MAGYYLIGGRKVANEYLVIATLGALIGGVSLARGGSKTAAPAQATASKTFSASEDEDAFIKSFLKEAEGSEEKKH